jgi:hypothetical protein
MRFVGIECGDDVRMFQLGGGEDLALKLGDRLLRAGKFFRQRLDHNDAVQIAVPRLVDLTHPPFAQLLQEDVLAEDKRGDLTLADPLRLIVGQ